jgi:hypothetical protein
VAWSVDFRANFVPEFEALNEGVQDELLAHVPILETFGRNSDARVWIR